MALHTTEFQSDHDPVVALAIDTVRLAIEDYRRGPGVTAKQQLQYHSAKRYLERTGLLALVLEHYGLTHPEAEVLIDEIA